MLGQCDTLQRFYTEKKHQSYKKIKIKQIKQIIIQIASKQFHTFLKAA